MKARTSVPVVVVAATVLIAQTTKTWSASVCGSAAHVPTSSACCDRSDTTAQSPAAWATSPTLALAINAETQLRDAFAAEVTRFTLRGNQSLLTSAATELNEPAIGNHFGAQHSQPSGSPTNHFAGIGVVAADAPSYETNTFPLEFSGQTEIVAETGDLPSVRRDFLPRGDALLSGSRATGFSFALSRPRRASSSSSASAVAEDRQQQDREAATFDQFPTSRSRASDDATRESRGLRLFSWSW